MKIITFAAIYIATYEVSLKVFEISPGKKIREIDFIRSRVELGKDAYTKGYIGYERMEELSQVLLEFKNIMEGYRVEHYAAYAGSVFKDAQNQLFLLDQLHLTTGIQIEILSNSERRFLGYKSVAFQPEFDEMIQQGAAVVDIGGNSTQITIFHKGRVVTTQQLVLGGVRLRQQMEKIGNVTSHYEGLIEEIVNKDLAVFKGMYLKQYPIQYLIFMGEYSMELTKKAKKKAMDKTIATSVFTKELRKLYKKNLEQISAELSLANENDSLLIPYMVLYTRIAEEFDAEQIWTPGVNMNDGIAYDYAHKKRMFVSSHDFEEDVLSAARQLSERYEGYSPHIDTLCKMSGLIYDSLKKVHGLKKREKLLLQVAAILHDCGKFISLAHHAECAYHIIMESEIIGLSHLEREIVANIVYYNTYPLDDYEELSDKLDHASYLKIAKLAAILRVANAMDRSHKQKFQNVRTAIRGKQFIITIESRSDILLEKGLLDSKADFFERVYGMKPVIKEKRIY